MSNLKVLEKVPGKMEKWPGRHLLGRYPGRTRFFTDIL